MAIRQNFFVMVSFFLVIGCGSVSDSDQLPQSTEKPMELSVRERQSFSSARSSEQKLLKKITEIRSNDNSQKPIIGSHEADRNEELLRLQQAMAMGSQEAISRRNRSNLLSNEAQLEQEAFQRSEGFTHIQEVP